MLVAMLTLLASGVSIGIMGRQLYFSKKQIETLKIKNKALQSLANQNVKRGGSAWSQEDLDRQHEQIIAGQEPHIRKLAEKLAAGNR